VKFTWCNLMPWPYLPETSASSTAACEVPGVSDGDGFRRGRDAVPDVLDELKALRAAERQDVLDHGFHRRILRWLSPGRKPTFGTG
jgi:hypothetical protein